MQVLRAKVVIQVHHCSLADLLGLLQRPMPINKETCRMLYRLRLRWGISRHALADESGYTHDTIRQWEAPKNNTRTPSRRAMIEWMTALVNLHNGD